MSFSVLLLRSGHTRRHVTETNHSMCTVQAMSCLTCCSNKFLGGNDRIFKEIFVSATKFSHHNKSHKFCLIWFCATCCSIKILLQRQRFSQKFFSTHDTICRCIICCNLLPSVYWPLRIQPSCFPKFKNVFYHSEVSMAFLHTMSFITDKTILMLS